MKILLISNYLTDAQESMQRFAAMLETGLTNLGHEVQLLRPEPRVGRLRPSATGVGKWLGYIDKFAIFPATLRQAAARADVVHICDHSNAIYTKYLQDVPHVVTCNDLLAIRSALGQIPENRTGWTGRQLQRLILNGLNRAQRIACISEHTRRDVLGIVKIPDSAVSTIYMGLNYPYSPMDVATARKRLETLGISKNLPFILHVGANHWYKNRLGVLAIFSQLTQKLPNTELHLVMAGQPWTDQMREFVKTRDLSEKAIELTGVDNEDLRSLYSCATALLFPSLQEGFGWPIIEAQACGCPVFTSNRAPMTEVGGEAAIYLDPTDPIAAAEAIARHLPDLPKLIPEGLANVQRFTASAMVEAYVRLYRNVSSDRQQP